MDANRGGFVVSEIDRLLEMCLESLSWDALGCVAGWISEE